MFLLALLFSWVYVTEVGIQYDITLDGDPVHNTPHHFNTMITHDIYTQMYPWLSQHYITIRTRVSNIRYYTNIYLNKIVVTISCYYVNLRVWRKRNLLVIRIHQTYLLSLELNKAILNSHLYCNNNNNVTKVNR